MDYLIASIALAAFLAGGTFGLLAASLIFAARDFKDDD